MSNEQTADLKKNQTGDMIKNALILFVITLIAGVLLGLVYQITKQPIADQNARKVEEANKAVFATASSFGQDNIVDAAAAQSVSSSSADLAGVTIDSVIEAYDASGNVIGYIVQITSKGYNDEIKFSMGITADGVLNGISLISISETPGLGMNAEKVLVPQYTVDGGLDATVTYKVVKDGTGKTSATDTSIEAISGATITSKAVTNGVDAGLLYYTNVLKGGQ
ncbi:electron transport complex protein RnfG [Butyrivibrio fibrisolvens DSM 3071]|jgi:electron transport complex protein RnfG|uniref:Ion-translocating oxidoreductase complex subunit G n=1 Tax=Butyrivibrio fibrisolvens DSM 3071 TaxID=1121131 RepID=A0A1M6EHQ7_BUTFI|nr:FMN-binding protein [Butyrivibrio fibrisolvens]SHI84818.1 electron transport complex protein RnfG [Butyrivibrio fibrisolvens DSM 3071]